MYDRVVKAAKEHGMSIAKLERTAGLSNGIISRWKVSSPTVKSVKAVARVLGVSVCDLIGEDDE